MRVAYSEAEINQTGGDEMKEPKPSKDIAELVKEFARQHGYSWSTVDVCHEMGINREIVTMTMGKSLD